MKQAGKHDFKLPQFLVMHYNLPGFGTRLYTMRLRDKKSGHKPRNVIYECEGSCLAIDRNGELNLYLAASSGRRIRRFCRSFGKSRGANPQAVVFWKTQIKP